MKKKTRNSDFYKMFTGIIEAQGEISAISINGSNKTFEIISSLAAQLKVDQSLCHDGVCLTVESIAPEKYTVTAIEETLSRSSLKHWEKGGLVNLERCLQINGRLDGHMVQGHVDTTARCTEIRDMDGSWIFTFEFPESFGHLIIEKGSISVNGISLTCFNVSKNTFSVAIIPYTFEHSNISRIVKNSIVNIEFDMIGKYINRLMSLNAGLLKVS
jgi:riboflavin synthase